MSAADDLQARAELFADRSIQFVDDLPNHCSPIEDGRNCSMHQHRWRLRGRDIAESAIFDWVIW